MPTKTRNPTGDGTFTGTWTAAPRWSAVDDHPDSGNPIADGITHGTTTAGKGMFTFTAFDVPTGATNISVQVLYYCFKNASQACNIEANLFCNDTTDRPNPSANHNPGNGNNNIQLFTDDYGTTNPKSGSAWTVNDVNGVGTNGLTSFGVISTDANPSITISSIQVQVTYDFNITLAVDSGSYSTTGTDATLKVGYKLAAATGSYSLTGTAADLTYTTVGYPVVASVTETTADLATSMDVAMPATVNSGDLLLIIHAHTNDQVVGTFTPSGWTMLPGITEADCDGDNSQIRVFAKVAAGTEGGGTVTITYNDTNIFATAQVYRITGWRNSGTVANDVEAVALFAATDQPDPPSLNPTNWDIEKTLWIAGCSEDVNDLDATTIPSGYTDGIKTRDDLRAQVLTCVRKNETATENPGIFGTNSTSGRVMAFTIAVRPSSGAQQYTMPADAGSYSITGTAVALEVGYRITAESGSASLTGTAANLLVAHRIVATDGSYAITGTDAILRKGINMVAESASYALSGIATNLIQQDRLVADLAAYLITGSDSNLEQTHKVVASSGSYTLTGSSSNLFKGIALPAGSGAYAISGTAANLKRTAILPITAGAYPISGTTAQLLLLHRMQAALANYLLTGLAAALRIDRRSVANTGSYNLTGTPLNLLALRRILASLGIYSIAGTSAGLNYSGAIAPPASRQEITLVFENTKQIEMNITKTEDFAIAVSKSSSLTLED